MVFTVGNFLKEEEIEEIRQQGEALGFEPSRVQVSPTGGQVSAWRASTGAVLRQNREQNELVRGLVERVSMFTGGRGWKNVEPLELIRYLKGHYFEAHTDFFKASDAMPEGKPIAQRLFTGLLFLNEGFKGGETHFPLLNLTVKSTRGTMLFFRNVDPEGRPDNRTLHRGLPVLEGLKLACNLWVLDVEFEGEKSTRV